MEFDPVNRDAPAPRYELESGSEDELDPREQSAPSQKFNLVATDGSAASTLEPGSKLVVLIGSAGASLLSSLSRGALLQQYSLRDGTDQHASIAVGSSSTDRAITIALVAPLPQLRSSRFHELANTMIEASSPSSIVIVDSYSPQEQLYRNLDGEDEAGWERSIRYLATPEYVAKHAPGSKNMTPLRSPESASGIGAAFLSKAVINNVPAILTLLEDVSFQSHIQLYGSLGASRLSPAATQTLGTLTSLEGGKAFSQTEATSKAPTLLEFVASRRVKPAANLAVLGDGNMYI